MNKKIGTNIFMATYDPNNEFDMAQSLWDEYIDHRGMYIQDFLSIVSDLYFKAQGSNNEFYGKVQDALEFMNGSVATNKGIPQKLINDYYRFYIWQEENKIDTTETKKTLGKMYINNPDRDWDSTMKQYVSVAKLVKASD